VTKISLPDCGRRQSSWSWDLGNAKRRRRRYGQNLPSHRLPGVTYLSWMGGARGRLFCIKFRSS